MSIAGSLILHGGKNSRSSFGIEEIPVRISFHFVPPRFDDGTTSSKNKLAFCQLLQPFAPDKTIASSAASDSLRSSQGRLSSTSLHQVQKLALHIPDVKCDSSKRKKVRKERAISATNKKGQIRFSRVGGVEILPGRFLSILNKHGGIEEVRKHKLWKAVKADLRLQHESTSSSNQLHRIYNLYQSRGMFGNMPFSRQIKRNGVGSFASQFSKNYNRGKQQGRAPFSSNLSKLYAHRKSQALSPLQSSSISTQFPSKQMVKNRRRAKFASSSKISADSKCHNENGEKGGEHLSQCSSYSFTVHRLDNYGNARSSSIGNFIVTNSKDCNHELIFDKESFTFSGTLFKSEYGAISRACSFTEKASVKFSCHVFDVVSHLHKSMVMFLDAVELGADILMKNNPSVIKELALAETSSHRSNTTKIKTVTSNTKKKSSSTTHAGARSASKRSAGSTSKSNILGKTGLIISSSDESSSSEESDVEYAESSDESVSQNNTTSSSNITEEHANSGTIRKKDAIDFFALYHKDYLSRYIEEVPRMRKTVEEAVCFWCKDGGSVVTCDCTPNFICGRDKNLRCPKVYHEVCLGFKVPETLKVWNCPRHFCKMCADYAKYLCICCPSSFCRKHIYESIQSEDSSKNSGNGALAIRKKLFEPLKIAAWDQKERFTGERKYVICSNCAVLEQKSLQRGLITHIAPRDDTWDASRKDANMNSEKQQGVAGPNLGSNTCTSKTKRKFSRDIAVGQAVPKTKKHRQDDKSNAASFVKTWVGKKVILGKSYNVKMKYLGKHAVVSSEAPNGWVDICIVENGMKGDHLRWRKSGLIELTTDQWNLAQSEDFRKDLVADT